MKIISQKHIKRGSRERKRLSESVAAIAIAAAYSDWWYEKKKHTQLTAALEPRPSGQLSVFHKAAIHLNFWESTFQNLH